MNHEKQTKIMVTIDDKAVIELLETRVKHVLRTDENVVKVIEQHIEAVVEKRVAKALSAYDVPKLVEKATLDAVNKQVDWKAMIRLASKKVIDHVCYLLSIKDKTPRMVQDELVKEAETILEAGGSEAFLAYHHYEANEEGRV